MTQYEHSNWHGSTGGTSWMQRAMVRLFRFLPLPLAYACMAPVIPFYMLFDRRGYQASYRFFRDRIGRGRIHSFLSVYANEFRMGQVVVDRFARETDSVLLCCIQFGVNGLLSLILALFLEKPDFRLLFQGWIPLLYTGVLSCGVAYTLQIVGQKHLHPTVASLLMSLESAFAVLGGWLILHERLSGRELIGCGLMLAAVLLVQLAPAKAEA